MPERKYNGITMEFLGNVIRNFRDEYRREYWAECTLTDEEIAECWDDNVPASSIEEEEAWTLDAMRELQKKGECLA